MKILASPAFSNKTVNPYNWLLYKEIQRLGHEVCEGACVSFGDLWSIDVWHVHWPEGALGDKNRMMAVRGVGLMLAKALVCKLLRIRIVWTAHNLRPHERNWPVLEKAFYSIFPRLVDGLVFLSESTRRDGLARLPFVPPGKTWVIPHGHYKDVYRCDVSREKAKVILDIPVAGRLFLFFGMIRPYKNVPCLLRAFAETSCNDATLAIVGGVSGHGELAAEIEGLANKDKRVRTDLRFLDPDELACWITASDVVVLPYSDIANSGSALLALSLARPVLAPNKGSMPELQRVVGDEWIMLFAGDVNASIVHQGAVWASARRSAAPTMDAFNWDRIAGLTTEIYKCVTGVRSTS